jgi:hypothetical protein
VAELRAVSILPLDVASSSLRADGWRNMTSESGLAAEPEIIPPAGGTSRDKPVPKKTATMPAATNPTEPKYSRLPIENPAKSGLRFALALSCLGAALRDGTRILTILQADLSPFTYFS